jgi:CRP/FNR family transcriptional regulator, cyclic AMP receptor protein
VTAALTIAPICASVKLSVLSNAGREAVVAMLGPGEFFGEGCLAGQPDAWRLRPRRRTAPSSSSTRPAWYACSTSSAPSRIGSSRTCWRATSGSRRTPSTNCSTPVRNGWLGTLVLLALDQPVRVVPPISQGTLAEMVGTTRSRVNLSMKKFQRLGFIDYTDGLTVDHSLLTVVLHG